MQELFVLARKIAPCDVNVLVTGETGTGKELLARAIHQLSSRSKGLLVAFSCANLPETLVEDELFGHEKGAFTGAQMSRRGRLETADHGTLFLDEIGDLGVGLQPKLLRVVQERSFERLGSNKTTSVDIRLICATHQNLTEMVKEGKFREDLYYRLNVVQLHLPSLRERRDDVPLLAQRGPRNILLATAFGYGCQFDEARLEAGGDEVPDDGDDGEDGGAEGEREPRLGSCRGVFAKGRGERPGGGLGQEDAGEGGDEAEGDGAELEGAGDGAPGGEQRDPERAGVGLDALADIEDGAVTGEEVADDAQVDEGVLGDPAAGVAQAGEEQDRDRSGDGGRDP